MLLAVLPLAHLPLRLRQCTYLCIVAQSVANLPLTKFVSRGYNPTFLSHTHNEDTSMLSYYVA